MASYENFRIYHPNGKQLMFLCSRRRFMWYVSRNIASVWPDDQMSATLTFMPKGLGDPEYMLKPRENRCVVCGGPHELTSHHVVPVCYRKPKIYVPPAVLERNKLIISGQKKVHSMVKHADKIPADKLLQIQQSLTDVLAALNMTEQDLMMAEPVNVHEYVVRKMKYADLVLSWKQHFVREAKPKFLPEWWEVDKVRLANDTNKILYGE